ncbi:uncharacterized protein LOC114717220 [Neltuma alba]|uniref:uncharacterized protein LOC114717220 n=1 Tax=Neltuma alba TaxID=207710 RepID=UPI0010A58562|nr:uncharacterized protein LOC114717220 [Prosopis alba]XP_028758148.1 uncharacterized protein LOC114717220 [Prosopis alba]XP_028758149.1 uncharacterized protein LOC114717220 [Prosopis alba]
MELRSCGHLHFIQAIQGGSIVKTLNVTRGRPKLSFKKVIDIYGTSMFDNNVKVERSCTFEAERRTVNAESDADACSANDGDDEENVLEDCNFGNLTLKQIQERCKSRKRKQSQDLDTSERKIKTEASSSEERCSENHMASDDSEFMETLSSWRSKLSKNKKAKKRKCINDQVSTVKQDVVCFVKSEVIQDSQESLSPSENSTALVEVKAEVPESDWSDPWRMLHNTSNNFQACCWPEDSLGIVAIEEPETARECVLGRELDYDWKEHADVIPLRIVWGSNADVSISDSNLSNDQSQNLLAIEFRNEGSEEFTMQPALHSICPQTINLDKDQDTDICSNQPDSYIAVTPLIANEVIQGLDLGNGGDDAFFSDCSKDEYTSVSELGCHPDGSRNSGSDGSPDESQNCSSDDSPVSEEKQLLTSASFDEERHASGATDESISWESHQSSSKVHRPQRLLSGRKTISPSSQVKLCKAMQSIDLHDKEYTTCKGKLFFGEQTDDEKKDTTEELDEIVGARFTKHCNKIRKIPKPLKRVTRPQAVQKSSLPSRSANSLSTGLTSMQSCAKNAISFSKRQMQDVECLAMKLANELKSMKDIMGAMLRSELCLTTPLRYKVNEARMAVKNATRAEETAKRTLSFMSRDCNRFCKLMQLAEEGPPASQDGVRNNNKSKKIAFADEAGGRLCQVRFYENEEGSLVESDRKDIII